jgi:hypothetical protein
MTEVDNLLETLDWMDRVWSRQRSMWIGRRGRLCRPIVTGSQVVLQVGTLGGIVDLTHERSAPFKVRFEDFPHSVVPLVEKLDILS